MNFGHCHYVPALKWKRGEARALRDFLGAGFPKAKDGSLTPLAEVLDQPWDWPNDQPRKTLDRQLNETTDSIVNHWGTAGPLFVDTKWVDPSQRVASGEHPVYHVAQSLNGDSVHSVPVTGPDRDTAHVSACARVHMDFGSGVAVRVLIDDLGDPNIGGLLDDLLQSLGIRQEELDLILDMNAIEERDVPLLAMSVATFINNHSVAVNARTLTVLSGAFPVNLAGFNRGLSAQTRSDWTLWQTVLNHNPRRLPAFGDYAVDHPDFTEIDPRMMRMSASIRYTVNQHWLIAKGWAVDHARHGGFSQYHDLAQRLQSHPEFSGRHFSQGDQYIDDVANYNDGPGNGEKWRQHPTNHHFHYVLSDLANACGP